MRQAFSCHPQIERNEKLNLRKDLTTMFNVIVYNLIYIGTYLSKKRRDRICLRKLGTGTYLSKKRRDCLRKGGIVV